MVRVGWLREGERERIGKLLEQEDDVVATESAHVQEPWEHNSYKRK
jgi:hypothetical protein